jgi:hypothetical protein
MVITDLKSFFYIVPMKIQALVTSCDEFLYACSTEIRYQSTEPVFNPLMRFDVKCTSGFKCPSCGLT